MIKIRLEGPAKTQEFFFPRLDIGLEVLGRRPGWGKNQAIDLEKRGLTFVFFPGIIEVVRAMPG